MTVKIFLSLKSPFRCQVYAFRRVFRQHFLVICQLRIIVPKFRVRQSYDLEFGKNVFVRIKNKIWLVFANAKEKLEQFDLTTSFYQKASRFWFDSRLEKPFEFSSTLSSHMKTVSWSGFKLTSLGTRFQNQNIWPYFREYWVFLNPISVVVFSFS